MAMFPQSLLKYESPRLVTVYDDEDVIKAKKAKPEVSDLEDVMEESSSEDEKEVIDETQELLDVLLPPRQYEEGTTLWIQRVSRSPATDMEVLNLEEQFDRELSRQEAREIGICPIRRELYTQCFDELIRQEIIECPERGKLYKMIRNETQMTVDTLRKVYESNIAFGVKKSLGRLKDEQDAQSKLEELLAEQPAILEKMNNLEKELEETEARLAAEEKEQLKEHKRKECRLKEDNERLLDELKDFLDKDFLEYT